MFSGKTSAALQPALPSSGCFPTAPAPTMCPPASCPHFPQPVGCTDRPLEKPLEMRVVSAQLCAVSVLYTPMSVSDVDMVRSH